jgi:hypothetical protein
MDEIGWDPARDLTEAQVHRADRGGRRGLPPRMSRIAEATPEVPF